MSPMYPVCTGLRLLPLREGMVRRLGLDHVFGFAGLELLEPEFELLDLAGDPLRRPAELHAAQLGDLELELLDLQRGELDRDLGRLELRARGRKFGLQASAKAR